MLKLIIIPLVSKFHPPTFYKYVIDTVKRDIENDVFHQEISKSEELNVDLKNYDIVCLLFTTGGTSKLGLDLLKNYGGKVIALSHPMHNSLPSVLSFKNRLHIQGGNIMHLHASNLNTLANYVKTLIKSIDVINRIRKIRIGVIGRGIDEEYKMYTRLFGGKFIFIPLKDVKQYLNNTKSSQINLTKLFNQYRSKVSNKYLTKAINVYLALKKIIEDHKLDVITVDCFKFINTYKVSPCIAFSLINSEGKIGVCEADYTMIPLMYISQYFTGKSGWIANIFDFSENLVKAAHCTIPKNMASNITFDSHFETNLPTAIHGELKTGEYTIVTLSKDLTKIFIRKVRVLSPLSLEYACRTQHLIMFEEPINGKLINNHHLISLCNTLIFDIIGYILDLSMV